MKALTVISLLILTGCSSIHKLVTTNKKSVDSTAAVVKDTAYKTVESTHSDNLDLKGVDVTVFYDTVMTPADSALAVAIKKPADRSHSKPASSDDRVRQLLEDAITASGHAGHITAITFHADSISDSSSRTLSVDSGAAHSQQKTQVKTDTSQVNKNIARTSPAWILYAGAVFIVLIVVLIILWRLGFLTKKI